LKEPANVKRIIALVVLLFAVQSGYADTPKQLTDVAYDRQMNSCRVLRKGSGVFFGESVFHVVRRCPKTTPDPFRVACHQTKSDSYCFAGPYGSHPRQVLDFYQATSNKPTPVVFYIHGGGWQNGDKKTNPKPFLDQGISVVAINYRYVRNGVEDNVEPPVSAPLEDAARALQFVRSKAAEWNLDKTRIGAPGGSAGGCSSLWLAFHDDMADPASDDPVARESTRLYCAAVNGAQVSLDPQELREWLPNFKLAERLKAANVDVVLVYPGQPHPVYKNATDYLIARLTE
jgi:hypothetical protein